MMISLLVRDYMQQQPLIFHPQQSLAQVVQQLLEHQQLGGPVCDDEGHLLGWISEKDCLAHLLDETYHCELVSLACDIMHKNVLSVSPDMSVLTLAEMAIGDKPKMYPVVAENRLVGMITRREMLIAFAKQLDECFIPHR
ncbi:CBS domain-containing protein [Celerinatantimonas sp. YJH-8]|uniref:CBS domain-containing protein n=1 Tax=Celerinatantimonas sp. YJH-8 TaxID=3228714 RepID=UPI0038C16160